MHLEHVCLNFHISRANKPIEFLAYASKFHTHSEVYFTAFSKLELELNQLNQSLYVLTFHTITKYIKPA